MKYTTPSMLVVLAAVVAVSHSSAIDLSPSQPELSSLAVGYGSESLPEDSYSLVVSEGLDIEADAVNGSSPALGAGIRTLFRGQYIRKAVRNSVIVHNQTWRGSSVIAAVRTRQVGADQGAKARVIAGGVGSTYVTVQMRSAVSRGFNIMLEIYGF